MPFFLLIVLGYLLRRRGRLTEAFFQEANWFVFSITLPVSLFCSIAFSSHALNVTPKFLWHMFLTTAASFVVIWAVTELVFQDKTMVGTLVQGAFRGNFALLGLPLVTAVMGNGAAQKAALALLIVVPTYNVLSVLVLNVRGVTTEKPSALSLLKGVATNPMILGIALALPVYFFELRIPFGITQTLTFVGNVATPLGLLSVGGLFRIQDATARLRPAMFAVAIKNVIQPVLLMLLSIFMGFQGDDLLILFVMYAAPVSVSSYPMASALGGDPPLASNIIILSTLLSAFVFAAGIYFLRLFQLI